MSYFLDFLVGIYGSLEWLFGMIYWDWVVVVGGVLLIAALTYFKPKGRHRWLTEARYYQITISLIGLTLFTLASITLGECLILIVLGWMISLRFEE